MVTGLPFGARAQKAQQTRILRVALAAIRSDRPAAAFDLDSTILINRQRQARIVREYGQLHGEARLASCPADAVRSWDLRDTLRFILRMARLGVHDVSVWTFSPYPGSELFNRLRAAGQLPRLDDDYYASLLSYSDISGAVSYADALESKQLQRYRLAGLLLFYGASYLTHPARPLRSLYNIATRRYESRMEMSFGNLVRRLATARAQVEAA